MKSTWEYLLRIFSDVSSAAYLGIAAAFFVVIIENLVVLLVWRDRGWPDRLLRYSARWRSWINKFVSYVANVDPSQYTGQKGRQL